MSGCYANRGTRLRFRGSATVDFISRPRIRLNMLKGLLLTLTFAVCPLLAQSNCDYPNNVTRIDSGNRRLFAIGRADQIATPTKARSFLRPLVKYVSRCQPRWVTEWNVSIFTEPTLALYKTEIENRSSGDARKWADSYIGEYNSRNQKLLLHPISPTDKKWIDIAE